MTIIGGSYVQGQGTCCCGSPKLIDFQGLDFEFDPYPAPAGYIPTLQEVHLAHGLLRRVLWIMEIRIIVAFWLLEIPTELLPLWICLVHLLQEV
ncbi:MAG: hypothetical protein IPG87_04030 [Saprospiraceae bacterium]|nr:hypothetical protein [Candidatus Vicinibacter affinis]